MDGPIPARWAPYLQGVLRVVAALLYICHGTQKAFGFPSADPDPGVPQGEPAVLFWFTWFFFAAAGAGPWSLDAAWRRPRSA